jgi:hypothetical protein
VALTLSVGCGAPTDTCEVPDAWAAEDFEEHAATPLALRGQLSALVSDTMRAAEEGTATVDDVADLEGPWEAGEPSLAATVSSAYAPVVEDAFGEFIQVIGAGAQDLTDDAGQWTPGEHGGLFGAESRGIDEGGLEVRQLVGKGAYGAVFYGHALALTEGDLDASTVDAIAAAWGAGAELDPLAEPADSAEYAHAMGFFGSAADELTAARAHAQDDACGEQRDAALQGFFRAWEQSLFARLVYYANEGVELAASAGSDDDRAEALHELSEGVGLAAGFRGLPDPSAGPLRAGARVIDDAAIDEILAALGVEPSNLGASSTGELLGDVPAFETAVEAVEGVVQETYGLSEEEVRGYRAPTPG